MSSLSSWENPHDVTAATSKQRQEQVDFSGLRLADESGFVCQRRLLPRRMDRKKEHRLSAFHQNQFHKTSITKKKYIDVIIYEQS